MGPPDSAQGPERHEFFEGSTVQAWEGRLEDQRIGRGPGKPLQACYT